MSLLRRRSEETKNEPGIRRFELDPEARAYIDGEFSEPPEDWRNYEPPEEEPPRKRHRLLRWLVIRLIILGLLVTGVNIGILLFTGQIWFNEPKKRDYPIRGPVVSESLGRVDWERFSKQNIQMAYIRATKSTTYVDENFKKNRSGAGATELPVGMLHVFDISMDGGDQAKHFMDTAGRQEGDLPPVVEVERRGIYKILPIDDNKLLTELREFVETVRSQWGCEPVIKCGGSMYELISGDETLSGCPVWYVSEYTKPDEGVDWTFWGYSSRVKYSYYESRDYLEMAVFSGDVEELEKLRAE